MRQGRVAKRVRLEKFDVQPYREEMRLGSATSSQLPGATGFEPEPPFA
jgi:hypothetical protein